MPPAIFHVTVATLIGAIAIAGVAIAMAPSTAVPITPPQPAAAPANPLLDSCVISAIGRLPKADGLRVTKSSYEYMMSTQNPQNEFWTVSISVDLQGRQATYQWACRLYGNSAELRNLR